MDGVQLLVLVAIGVVIVFVVLRARGARRGARPDGREPDGGAETGLLFGLFAASTLHDDGSERGSTSDWDGGGIGDPGGGFGDGGGDGGGGGGGD
jgi:uncharacterized membrane protein YgcG